MSTLQQRLTAEFFGTLFLVAAVVGSGIMGDRLSGGNIAIALLANTAALIALFLEIGPEKGIRRVYLSNGSECTSLDNMGSAATYVHPKSCAAGVPIRELATQPL